jgi:hypothetical protein
MTFIKAPVARFREDWIFARTSSRLSYVTAMIGIAGLACLSIALSFFIGDDLWSVKTLDAVVRAGLIGLSLMAVVWLFSTLPFLQQGTRRRL